MADNIIIQSATLGTVPVGTEFATDEIGGVHWPLTKLAFGDVEQALMVTNDIPLPVVAIDAVDFGARPYFRVSTSGLNQIRAKNGHAFVYGIQVFNTNAAARYIKLFDQDTTPVAGSDEPVKILLIPGSTTGASLVLSWAKGLEFSYGIGFCLTTGVAPDNTDPVEADEIVVNIDFI